MATAELAGKKRTGWTWSLIRQGWSTVLIILIWHMIATYGPYPRFMLPTPLEVVMRGWHVASSGFLWEQILASLRRQVIGFGLAMIIGMSLGFILGISQKARTAMIAPLRMLYPIPGLAWIPLAILWFGIGDESMIFVIVIAAIWPVMFNTISGVDAISTTHLRAAKSLGANWWTMFTRVYLPGSLAFSITGMRLSFGTSWRVIVGAEIIAASTGLGYMINNARSILRGDELMVGMVVIAVIGYITEKVIFDYLEKATLDRWGMRAAN
ncbi:ABC transporter permease [Castellaniella sp.]|uniref:ABC transporter permease n=1 Tax=Castellaniella sp. TaxID=1955812 RepID=UPI0035618983